jgi:tetratricopeptide (TPR) repeat protein
MKNRITLLIPAAALIVICASADAGANQEMLASAKSLYESASYEAALSELSAIQSTELVDTVDTYRALCLLGLGRVRDAEQALELVVNRKPLMVLSDTEYSPRVIALFRDVRKKALPAAAQQLYTAARTDYENKKYEAAAAGFKQALQVIADINPDSQTATLADLKELASGFLALADAKVSAQPAPRAAAPTAAAAAAAAAPPPVAPRVAPAFYTLADTDVTPPVVVEQQVPAWTYTAYAPNRVFNGTLELVIDEKGLVESATLAEPVWPPYDLALLSAAKRWRYEPAQKAGKPVKFKRVLVLNIDPSTLRSR